MSQGFSGFADDPLYTSLLAATDDSEDQEVLRKLVPHIFKPSGEKKQYIDPLKYLEMRHDAHYQLPLYENPSYNLLIAGSRDSGKALLNSSLLYTPKGNIEIGNAKVGQRIYDDRGELTTITGVFPQGITEVYRLTLSDGRYVDCSGDHLWTVYEGKSLKTLSTIQLLSNLYRPRKVSYKIKSGKEARYFIPAVEAVKYPEKSLPLDPYTLGALIGDGSLTMAPSITVYDKEILDKIPYTITTRSEKHTYGVLGISPIIKQLGLNVKSEHKHIPKEYLTSSIEQRMELVRGLMDTDGTVGDNGYVEYSTSSPTLADDILLLLRSLGIIAKKSKRKTKSLDNYRIFCVTTLPIFHLQRKKTKLKRDWKKISIKSIEKIENGSTTCITVDNESKLFLTDNYTPTHNSYIVGPGFSLHQWLFDGAFRYSKESIDEPRKVDITIGAEGAEKSKLILDKVRIALEMLPGAQEIGGKYYKSPFAKQYAGSWALGKEIKAEYQKKIGGDWKTAGSRSMLKHRSFRDNPFADQGSRPSLIVLEEAGLFSNLREVYYNTKDNLVDGLKKIGSLVMMGTGGDMDKGTADMAEMFYNPEAYSILPFQDKWENKGKIGYFIHTAMVLNEFLDEDGHTNFDAAMAKIQKEREGKKKISSDQLNKLMQYRPIKPSEMFLARTSNIFPAPELRRRLSEITTDKFYESSRLVVDLIFDPTNKGGVKYEVNHSLSPIDTFPTKDNIDREGAVILFEPPQYVNGEVPEGMYIIGCDPFKDDSTTGESLASIYVLKTNKYPHLGYSQIVATYAGRPFLGKNAVNETLYKLSLLYGKAKIYFENNVGNVKDYFEKIQRLDLLALQPITVFNKKASYNTMQSMIYGYSISNDKVK